MAVAGAVLAAGVVPMICAVMGFKLVMVTVVVSGSTGAFKVGLIGAVARTFAIATATRGTTIRGAVVCVFCLISVCTITTVGLVAASTALADRPARTAITNE